MALALACRAQVRQTAAVLDGAGAWASGGPYRQIGALAQPGAVAEARAGSRYSQAGFLSLFALQPARDCDGDGLADEADGDNDGDRLDDWAELSGVRFAPPTPTLVNVADTDRDGVTDGAEAVAGTNPTDAESRFQLVSISRLPGACEVAWRARGNHERLYVVRARTNLTAGAQHVVFSNTVAGGVAPWYAATNFLSDSTDDRNRFYIVEALP